MAALTITEKTIDPLDEVIRKFLEIQLGEKSDTVSCYLNKDILAIYAHGIISPAEQTMMNSPIDHKLLIEYKIQQFESVRSELSRQIKQLLGREIRQMYTSITDDGIRIINICLID